MKEIRVLVWCDGPHENVNVGDGVVTHEVQINGGPRATIDLCPACKVKYLNPLAFLVSDKGVEVEPVAEKVPACPDCGFKSKNRNALGAHLRKLHGKGLRDL